MVKFNHTNKQNDFKWTKDLYIFIIVFYLSFFLKTRVFFLHASRVASQQKGLFECEFTSPSAWGNYIYCVYIKVTAHTTSDKSNECNKLFLGSNASLECITFKVTSPNTANQNGKSPPSSLYGFLVSRSDLSGGLCELLYARYILCRLFLKKECKMQVLFLLELLVL